MSVRQGADDADAPGADIGGSNRGPADPNSVAVMTEVAQTLVRTWWPLIALAVGIAIIAFGGFLFSPGLGS